MEPPITTPDFQELTERVRSGKCTAFIGAGLSAEKYPTWDELLARLCSACELDISLLQGNGYSRLAIAQAARNANTQAYESTLRDVFRHRDPTYCYMLVAQLPFHAYLTTNYDSLVVDACRLMRNHGVSVSQYPNLRVENMEKGEVFYLHGRIDHHHNDNGTLEIVLTDEDFRQAYTDTLLSSFLAQYLTFHSVCFLGCGFEDEHLQKVFRLCDKCRAHVVSHGHKNEVRWYLLVDSAAPVLPAAEACGLRVIRYDRMNDTYDGLRRVLEYWRGLEPPALRPLTGDEKDYRYDVEAPR